MRVSKLFQQVDSFDEKADWYRNALAANGCVIEWEGVEYRLIDPQMVSPAVALPAFNTVERRPVIGIKQCIQFRSAPANRRGCFSVPGFAQERAQPRTNMRDRSNSARRGGT